MVFVPSSGRGCDRGTPTSSKFGIPYGWSGFKSAQCGQMDNVLIELVSDSGSTASCRGVEHFPVNLREHQTVKTDQNVPND